MTHVLFLPSYIDFCSVVFQRLHRQTYFKLTTLFPVTAQDQNHGIASYETKCRPTRALRNLLLTANVHNLCTTFLEISHNMVPSDVTVPAIDSKCRQMCELVIHRSSFTVDRHRIRRTWLCTAAFVKVSVVKRLGSEQTTHTLLLLLLLDLQLLELLLLVLLLVLFCRYF